MDKLGKIRQLRGKERLKIVKNAKYECDLLKSNEDMALQSREILQTFVWWGVQICPLPYKVQLIFITLLSYIFACLRRVTFKTWHSN